MVLLLPAFISFGVLIMNECILERISKSILRVYWKLKITDFKTFKIITKTLMVQVISCLSNYKLKCITFLFES